MFALHFTLCKYGIYLVDPAYAAPTSKLTTVAWQKCKATMVSLRLVSSRQRFRRGARTQSTCIFCGLCTVLPIPALRWGRGG